MPGMDESVDGFMLMGRHAKAGTAGAFLPHTWMLEWADFSVNGQSIGEMGIEACFAGHWGVPTILAQGAGTACREAETLFPGIVTASVKDVESHDVCSGLDAEAAHQLTARKLHALTVLHNYAVQRTDGSTAAERFYGAAPRDLFCWLLEHTSLPARPRSSRRTA